MHDVKWLRITLLPLVIFIASNQGRSNENDTDFSAYDANLKKIFVQNGINLDSFATKVFSDVEPIAVTAAWSVVRDDIAALFLPLMAGEMKRLRFAEIGNLKGYELRQYRSLFGVAAEQISGPREELKFRIVLSKHLPIEVRNSLIRVLGIPADSFVGGMGLAAPLLAFTTKEAKNFRKGDSLDLVKVDLRLQRVIQTDSKLKLLAKKMKSSISVKAIPVDFQKHHVSIRTFWKKYAHHAGVDLYWRIGIDIKRSDSAPIQKNASWRANIRVDLGTRRQAIRKIRYWTSTDLLSTGIPSLPGRRSLRYRDVGQMGNSRTLAEMSTRLVEIFFDEILNRRYGH